MKPYPVYPVYPINITRAADCYLWDADDKRYLDLYGGHAVISIGHSHPKFNEALKDQIDKIIFYSNSIKIRQQEYLAGLLGERSGYPDYDLFLCNSGAEANENALKLASFVTGRRQVITFDKAFHGRTSLAVELTDNPNITAPVNQNQIALRLPLNNYQALEAAVNDNVAAIIVEGMQGVAGIYEPEPSFLQLIAHLAEKHGCLVILDEVQSGVGRTGRFFAHQFAGIKPHLITMAKGMGNGFPIGGVLIHPSIEPVIGRLGTTFGGNHLACVAALTVIQVIEEEDLINRAAQMGTWLADRLNNIEQVTEVRGRGLILGVQLDRPAAPVRNHLLNKYKIFTGAAAEKNTIRLLPPLTVRGHHLDYFIDALEETLNQPAE